jgi:hypothetical protein
VNEQQPDVDREQHHDENEELAHGRKFASAVRAGKPRAGALHPHLTTGVSFHRPFSMSDA